MLSIMAGVQEPDSGAITTGGKVSAILSLETQFHPDYTGWMNILHHFGLQGYDRSAAEGLSKEAAEFSGLGEHLGKPFRTYSNGMKARLAFSCVTAVEPSILLIDETLSVGDVSFSRKATQRIIELIHKGAATLLASHDLDSLRRFCSRVIWLHEGRVYADGPPADVLDEYATYVSNHEVRMALRHFSDLKNRRHENNGSLRISQVEVAPSVNHEKRFLFKTHDPLIVRFRVQTGKIDKCPVFFFSITNLSGLVLWAARSDFDTSDIPGNSETVVAVDCGGIPFNEGFYMITIEARSGAEAVLDRAHAPFKVERPFIDSHSPIYYYRSTSQGMKKPAARAPYE